ncbi:MAG: hypothetical protein JWR42_2511 [Marmoricola sp.]|nr:hypothetical protein [Marmoricola sp.]
MRRRRRVPAQRRIPQTLDPTGTTEPVASSGPGPTVNKYARLPPPVRREDLRTSQDVLAHGDEVGEADRERAWLLRTTGLFI